MLFDEEITSLLACPNCNADLIYDKNESELRCQQEGLVFKIDEGIANLAEYTTTTIT